MIDNLKLIEPTPDLVTAFRAMAAEWKENGDDKFGEAFNNFTAYVEALLKQKEPNENRPDRVPGSTYWLIADDNRIVGTSRLRYWLVPRLEKEGGHIGYDIRPSERRKGYGTKLLALTLVRARDIGLEEVLITCDSDNVASMRIIEKNGGQNLGSTVSDRTGKKINRYRIVLSSG